MAGLFARGGYEARGILNHAATIERLRTELVQAADAMEADDWLVLTFSGHGGRGTAWGGVGFVETLCLFDGQLPDYDLRVLLSGFKDGVNVVMIFDACHSGGMDRGNRSIRFAPSWVTEQARVSTPAHSGARGRGLEANVMLLAACRPDEVAMDGEDNGGFTLSLLRTMSDGMNYAGWIQMAGIFCAEKFPCQHPQLINVSGEKLGSREVLR